MARDRLQLIVFLLVLPAANLLFIGTILFDAGNLTAGSLVNAALRLWSLFGVSYVAIRLLETLVPRLMPAHAFWRQLAGHLVVIAAAGSLVGLTLTVPRVMEPTGVMIMPRVVLALEITIYLAVMRILRQQERAFASEASLREAELNVLRAQSNPHFLFNTLGLITSEISRDPDNAKEIVFDLADLLRSNIQLAEQSRTTLTEEIRLVSLYLALQQQRFKDRLSYTVDIAPDAGLLSVPALLLQPVVENTVKWAVAPHPGASRIAVSARRRGDRLSIVFRDSGPVFDDQNVVEGNGFRILRKTLALNYPDQWQLSLESTPEGGVLSIDIPAISGAPEDG